MPRPPGRTGHNVTAETKAAFLAKLAETGNASEAAESVGFARKTMYRHRDSDEEFDTGWIAAQEEAYDKLEREAWRRGVEGVDEPVFYQGEVCGHVRRYSDNMLGTLLRGNRPKKYNRMATPVNPGDGESMPVTFVGLVQFAQEDPTDGE